MLQQLPEQVKQVRQYPGPGPLVTVVTQDTSLLQTLQVSIIVMHEYLQTCNKHPQEDHQGCMSCWPPAGQQTANAHMVAILQCCLCSICQGHVRVLIWQLQSFPGANHALHNNTVCPEQPEWLLTCIVLHKSRMHECQSMNQHTVLLAGFPQD